MFQILRMKPFINERGGAKSRPKRPSRFFANAPLSESERRSLLPIIGGIVTELKTPQMVLAGSQTGGDDEIGLAGFDWT